MLKILLISVILGTMFQQDVIKTNGGEDLTIGFLGHASIVFIANGKVIYVDPVGMFADYTTAPKADVILITHHHDDHLDSSLIDKLCKDDTQIIGNVESVNNLGKGYGLRNEETCKVGDYLDIEAVAAYNTTPEHAAFHPSGGRDNGYILTIDGTRIYVAGDSEPTPEMLALQNIDVAFLPVNQPYTMTVEQAVTAAKAIKPVIFYPYHTGQTEFKTDLDMLLKELSTSGIDVRIRNME